MRLVTKPDLKRVLLYSKNAFGIFVLTLLLFSSSFVFNQNAEAQYDLCRVEQITFTDINNSNNLIDHGPSIDDSGNIIGFNTRGAINGPNPGDNAEAYILDVAIDELTQVTDTLADANFNTALSANGQYLAFESAGDVLGPNAGGNQELYLFNRQNGVITQITDEPAGDSDSPAINADGTLISFRSGANINGGNPSGNLELFFWSADTGIITQVTETQDLISDGDIGITSVDAAGDLIAFFSTANINGNNPDQNQEMYLYHVPTGIIDQLTNTTIGDSGIMWLNGPGTLLVFSSNANLPNGDPHAVVDFPSPFLNTEIWLYNIITGEFTQITHTLPGENSNRPQISSDGDFISFDSTANINGGNPDGNREVYRYNRSTGRFIQITDIPGESIEASINGNGFRIVFESTGDIGGGNPDRNEEIYLATCGVSANVPTLSEWGLIAMAAVLGIVGFMVVRRKQLAV